MDEINQDNPKTSASRLEKAVLIGLLVVIVIAIVLYFALPRGSDETDTSSDSAEITVPEIEKISAPEVRSILAEDDKVILLDVRKEIEYAEEHIDGATNIPFGDLEDMKNYLPTDILIITMCDGSNCQRSSAAAENLVEWGYKNVKNFAGGTEEWQAEAYPLTVGAVSEVRLLKIPKISVNELKNQIDTSIGITIIDTRNPVDYSAGHIPNADNISFADIEALAKSNSINLDRQIIIYGGDSDVKTEMTAQSLLANGASDVAILDGGYSKWQSAGYEIEK